MINKKLHTPEGVKDYLPFEFTIKSEIEHNIEYVFYKYGYYPIKNPTFEYMEVFDGKGSIDPMQMYKFLDRDGSILALRSDMTPAIARIASTAYDKKHIPLRFYYIENAFRYNENYQGKLREFTQAGIELIGVNSFDADAEIIAVAINSLLASGLDDFRIDIGQVQFFKGILEEALFDKETCSQIQKFMNEKNFVEVEKIVKNTNANKNIKTLFSQLPLLIGGKEIIKKTKNFIKNKTSLEALNALEKIYKILEGYGLNKYVSFDLSMIGNFDYYTGLIFRGYTYGTGFSIIDGGRYDNLILNYGSDYPSVGFAIKINDLMNALINQNMNIQVKSTDTLLVYTEEGKNTALKTADELRNSGLSIENSLLGADIEKNIKYAKFKKMGGILYFIDNEKVEVINILTNESNLVTISELLHMEE